MIQTTQAKMLWEAIPNSTRLKLLNNVYCADCMKTTGVGSINMTVERGALIINGVCTSCGHKVARLVETNRETISKANTMKAETPDFSNPDILPLVQFRSGTKAAELVNSIKALKLKSFGDWDPRDEGEDEDSAESEPSNFYNKILAVGKRPCWELENILPGFDSSEDFDCPIGEGIDLMKAGDWDGAVKHMKKLLKMDPRCLDAYAHLGNWYFETGLPSDLNSAKNYYKLGVAIGMKSIGKKKANDVFAWGLIDNRPLMRCLHGLGLCFYRQKKLTEALLIFLKILWLNPSDNQGIRFLIKALLDGVSWKELQEQEDEQVRH